MKKRYSIGEISKLCNISVKALRYYDQKGLVVPEKRDEETGYRQYSKKQLLQLLIIQELKPLGFSLDEIRNILNQQDLYLYRKKLTEKREAIVQKIQELETQLRITNRVSASVLNGINILHSYEDIKSSNSQNDYIIKTETIPQMFVISTRYPCKYNVADPFYERHAEIQRIRDDYELHSSGSLMAVFHDHFTTQFFSDTCDLEVMLPIVYENQDCPIIRRFGDFLAATAIHVGAYTELLPVYFALAEWIDNHGFEINGPPVEQYLVGPIDLALEKNYVTKIIWPVKNKR